jgi:hypothetical protein
MATGIGSHVHIAAGNFQTPGSVFKQKPKVKLVIMTSNIKIFSQSTED